MDAITALEWAAFGISLLGVYIYGENLKWGAIVCLVGALLIVALGGLTAMWGMALFNAGFVLVHAINIRKCYQAEKLPHQWTDIGSGAASLEGEDVLFQGATTIHRQWVDGEGNVHNHWEYHKGEKEYL